MGGMASKTDLMPSARNLQKKLKVTFLRYGQLLQDNVWRNKRRKFLISFSTLSDYRILSENLIGRGKDASSSPTRVNFFLLSVPYVHRVSRTDFYKTRKLIYMIWSWRHIIDCARDWWHILYFIRWPKDMLKNRKNWLTCWKMKSTNWKQNSRKGTWNNVWLRNRYRGK